MSLVLRWQVPDRRLALRWRGPAGLAAALEREPLAPIAAVVGPPGSGSGTAFPPMAILADAATPVPADGIGSAAWSTVVGAPVVWDGGRWRAFAFFVEPPAQAPAWVPAGALVVSDFKNGLYWRQDIGVCGLADIWESGDGYNGPWTSANVFPGLGISGSLAPQVTPEVFAMLDPLGDGFTAVLDGNIVSGDDAGSDAYLSLILAEPSFTNEWGVILKITAPANPTTTYINCGDYEGPVWTLAVPDIPYYVGHHRGAISISSDGVAGSLDGLATHARARAEFNYEPKPNAAPGDPDWRMLVTVPADHGNTVSYTEKAVFYSRVDDADLDALSALPTPDYGNGAAPLAAGTVSWIGTNASDEGGWLTCTGSAPSGALADGALDASLPIALAIEFAITGDSTNSSQATVVFLDTVTTANYTWPLSDFVAGVLEYPGGSPPHELYHELPGSQMATGIGLVDGSRVRIRSDGDDLVFYTLAGAVETEIWRDTGILAGKTTLYLKVLFAEPEAGRRIKVTAAAQD